MKKLWYLINREYCHHRSAEYYENNKEKLKENYRNYYYENRDKILEKTNCECGGKYVHKQQQRHFKTAKHINWIRSTSALAT